MQIKNIIAKEDNNANSILLFREGIFWRAYERSAFLFITHLKPYRLSKKYYKNVGCEIVFCGFPNTTLDELLAKVGSMEVLREENMIRITGFEQIENEIFLDWKYGIPSVVKENKPEYSACKYKHNLQEQVIEHIRNFSVVRSTPLECQQLLVKLQEQLNGTI